MVGRLSAGLLTEREGGCRVATVRLEMTDRSDRSANCLLAMPAKQTFAGQQGGRANRLQRADTLGANCTIVAN